MADQLDFQLAEIDRKETRKKVEEHLEKYRLMLLQQDLDMIPKLTPNYSFDVPPSNTNKFHSNTEDAAIANVDFERERRDFIRRISMAVNRLGYKERQILIRRYMTMDDMFDYEVYNELNMSERTYHRIKSRAFYRLAFALRIEVYKEREVSV